MIIQLKMKLQSLPIIQSIISTLTITKAKHLISNLHTFTCKKSINGYGNHHSPLRQSSHQCDPVSLTNLNEMAKTFLRRKQGADKKASSAVKIILAWPFCWNLLLSSLMSHLMIFLDLFLINDFSWKQWAEHFVGY